MAYVITQNCCKDASCVPVCPVDCIRPVGGPEAAPTSTEMLYIDPDACIDCGACMEECPVDAIHYEDDLPEPLMRFKDINAAYFEQHPLEPDVSQPFQRHAPVSPGRLRVAVVGAGPAACYAVADLIDVDGVEVNVFEKLPTPYGLVRAGVAPDHQHTKSVVGIFEKAFRSPRVQTFLNVEIGKDLDHDDLVRHHHAVIYAVGATETRRLGIAGEDLPGSHAASDFVNWYNGHPEYAGRDFDLSSGRAVIIGNGNVALDIARILLTAPEDLAFTDISDHAVEALRNSRIQEVVLLGRRGVRHAAFSVGEFLALGHLDGVDVVVEGDDDLDPSPNDDVETSFKLRIAAEYSRPPKANRGKRIRFRFLTTPVEIVGDDAVRGISVSDGRTTSDPAVDGDVAETEVLEAGLVLRSIGYRCAEIPGLPRDEYTGVVTNVAGRVVDLQGRPVPGVYVTGWSKRGPQGVIGTNRSCARETVVSLFEDFDAGALDRVIEDDDALTRLVGEKVTSPVNWQGWEAIDSAERRSGAMTDRPRTKLLDITSLLAAAAGGEAPTSPVGCP